MTYGRKGRTHPVSRGYWFLGTMRTVWWWLGRFASGLPGRALSFAPSDSHCSRCKLEGEQWVVFCEDYYLVHFVLNCLMPRPTARGFLPLATSGEQLYIQWLGLTSRKTLPEHAKSLGRRKIETADNFCRHLSLLYLVESDLQKTPTWRFAVSTSNV